MMAIIKKLGSVSFTVVISAALIVLSIVSTSVEAIQGTAFVQKAFYQTRWFDILVSFLWINIFCSTILRFPFKKSQIGFLITHVGILGLLAGALMARTHGVEGQMTLFEGETLHAIKQPGYTLGVSFPNQEETAFALRKGSFQFMLTKERLDASVPFCSLKAGNGHDRSFQNNTGQPVDFNIINIIENAVERREVVPGNDQAPLNHAVRVRIQSKQLAEDAAVWLVEHDAQDAAADKTMTGPVTLVLRPQAKAAAAQKPVLRVSDKAGHEIAVIDVGGDKPLAASIPLGRTGFTIKGLAYYPYAAVAGKKIINLPDAKRFNPAVVFDLVDAKGTAVRNVKFAFFPEFESMHPQTSAPVHDLQIKFDAGTPADLDNVPEGLQVAFYYDQENAWRYQSRLQDKILAEGPLTTGACVPAGWMDVDFCVEAALSHVHVSYAMAQSKDGQQGGLAAALMVPSVSGSQVYWVFEDKTTPVRLAKGEVTFLLKPRTAELPFSLALKQFRKIDYPGTQDAASYESDVVLADAKRKLSLEGTIAMNHPLEYQGYKIFQSSYFTDPQYGKASVFTVARNPGIPLIYIGSILACLGALFQFYGPRQKTAAA